jgi:glycosyltransferase involved in cell wall biosynthesis
MYSDTVVPRADGVAVALEALGSGLQHLGAEVELAAPRQPYTGALPIWQTPSLRPPRRDYHVGLVAPWVRASRLSAKNYDVVHVHTLGPVGLAGLTAAHDANVPAVLTWHTDLIAYRPYYSELRLGTLMAAATIRRLGASNRGGFVIRDMTEVVRRVWAAFDIIIAPTPKVQKALQCLGCSSPIAVLPSPTLPLASPAVTAAELRSNLSIAPDAPIVLSVGRLSREKNQGLLLRSFALVKQGYQDAHLLLVGPPRGSHELTRLARRLNIDSSVHMPGAADRSILGAYYAAADIFVVPSLTETQCLVANEAEAFGLPVIVVDEGLRGASGKRPRILTKPHAEDLRTAIAECLPRSHPKRPAGYPAPERFLPVADGQAGKLLEIYSSLTDGT